MLEVICQTTIGQSPIEIEAKVHDTIRNIKSMIQAKKKMIPSNHFTLFFGGQLLEERGGQHTGLVSIKDKSTLQVILAPKDNLSISVKAPSGQTIKLKVKALFTVSDVKNIVGNITGISMIIVRNLIYAGKKLEDHKTLVLNILRI
ncbi:hypothetical protein C1H46_004834 [Malus baccata]|uniref:Ubiquitin-like domain-containing protein n=1 Tax=Malus baccata TaxID=106549 RepID=A0A540NEZ8_MALBA|nr:hypothetical protein C1H46_004834 [Malus baccata]